MYLMAHVLMAHASTDYNMVWIYYYVDVLLYCTCSNVTEQAENTFSPQPSIIMRKAGEGEVKDMFLVIQRKPFPTKLEPKKVMAALFASFTVFNVHYPDGCTNFFSLVEVLFLNKKIPPR